MAPYEPAGHQRHWPVLLGGFVAGVLGAAAVIGISASLGLFDQGAEPVPPTSPPVTVIERVTTEIIAPEAMIETAEAVGRKVIPSVVTVEVGSVSDGDFTAFASGSGVVLDEAGVIVTNHHVVEDAQAIRVIFADGLIYDAAVTGSDLLTDLAVIELDATGLNAIERGSTEDLAIGQTAIAVGNPLGLEGEASLTVGVLSAFNRAVQLGPQQQDNLFGMLQTDAPINSGSSGGALVDADGRLIGITTAIGVSRAGPEGIGFAIPVELVTRITDEIRETGGVRHAFLGITGEPHLEQVSGGATAPGGALIVGIFGADSAAASAGLEEGDVIVTLDGTDVRTMQDLINALRYYRVGDVVIMEVLREGDLISVDVVLGERPPDA